MDGADIIEHSTSGQCPLGYFNLATLRPPADLSGYDPATDPNSPIVGGCCDPPKP